MNSWPWQNKCCVCNRYKLYTRTHDVVIYTGPNQFKYYYVCKTCEPSKTEAISIANSIRSLEQL